MEKTLIIVRHGNTFRTGETPRRIGGQTDLPLVEESRPRAIGRYMFEHGLIPDKVYAAPLLRTMGTVSLILDEMLLSMNPIPEQDFTEIDYGPDENKTEEEVLQRLGKAYLEKNNLPLDASPVEIAAYGKKAIDLWNNRAIVPDGWLVNMPQITRSWKRFADSIEDGETVLLCTSNGIIRFAPHLLDTPFEDFCRNYGLKVATGGISIFKYSDGKWVCTAWNIQPFKMYKDDK